MINTTIITAIMSSITTIVVAMLGVFQARRAKETSEYKKLQDELNAEREKQRKIKEEEDEMRWVNIEKSVEKIQHNVEQLEKDLGNLTDNSLSDIAEQLSHLHLLQTDNFGYIQSLSNVVLTIGETLNDSDVLDDESKSKMMKSISTHRDNEEKLHKKLYTIIT